MTDNQAEVPRFHASPWDAVLRNPIPLRSHRAREGAQ